MRRVARLTGVAFASTCALILGAWVCPARADAAPGEPEPRREVAFDYGLRPELIQIRDDTLRPLRWTGGTLGLVLGLDVYRASGRHRADVDLAFGPVFNRYGHVGVVFEQGLHYAYVHRVAQGRPFDVLVGGAYRYHSLDAVYADWDDSFMYWFTMHTLAPAVAFEARPSPLSDVLVSIELPLVGIVSRPPEERIYKVDPMNQPWRWFELTHQDSELAGPTDLFAPTLSAAYVKRWGPHFGLRLAAEAYYRHYLDPKPFHALAERVSVELRHAF